MKVPPHPRVLIVDEDHIAREGLVSYLSKTKRFRVCGAAADAESALRLARRHRPTLIVIDVPAGTKPPLAFLESLTTALPRAGLVAICAEDDAATQQAILQAGVRGFIHRTDAPACLPLAFAALLRGERYASPHAQQRTLDHMAARPAPPPVPPGCKFTATEEKVLALLGSGVPRAGIARQHGTSPKTIDTHFQNLKQKLRLPSTSALTTFAMQRRAGQSPTG